MANNRRVESNSVKLFIFNAYSEDLYDNGTRTVYIYKLLLPDSSKNLTFILRNLAKNSIFVSIFDLRPSNSTSKINFTIRL